MQPDNLIIYHVMSDGHDAFYKTLKGARNHFADLKRDGNRNIRIYKEYQDKYTGDVEEVCLESIGNFPTL